VYKSVAVIMVVLAAGGAGFAAQWLWTRVVLVFVLFAVGMIYKGRP
jgi:hypothetical protein